MTFIRKEFGVVKRLRGFFLLSFMLLLSGCGGGGGGEVSNSPQGIPCPAGSPIGPANGSGRFLFYKVSCDPAKPESLWAVDPDNVSAPIQFESEFIPGSFHIVTDGVWDLSARKITGRGVRFLVYAKKDGRLYKVSAMKSDALAQVPVSNETGMNAQCSAFTLDDFADVNDSRYIYTVAGPDQRCGASDDNIEKMVRIGMGSGESPIATPNDLSHLVDYVAPLTPGVVPGSAVPNRLVSLIDLIDKESGAIDGWLAVNDRISITPPAIAFKVKNVSGGILETTPFEHGLSEGTRIQLSGPLPGGLEPNKIYSVHVTSPRTFKLYRTRKQQDGDEVGFSGGTVIDAGGHTHPTPEDCAGKADCPDQVAIGQGANPKHIDVNMVILTSDGSGTFSRVASHTDLYRCGKDLADCQPLKQTEFITVCKVSGDNQIGALDADLPADFVVEVKDSFGNPVSGVAVTWSGGDKEEETCVLFICSGGDEDDVNPAESTTGGNGRTSARGILRENEGDTETHLNHYGASVDGIGTPLSFAAGTGPQEKPLPPSCKKREDFVIAGVTPLRSGKYGGLFNGKIVIRFDLQYKPDPGNADAFLANQVKTKGDLYLYDIATNQLSLGAEYSSKEAFPEGLPFVSDFDATYFADKGTLHRLPFGGALPFGNAQALISEGSQVAQLDLTANRVVYSLVQKSSDSAISTLRTIGKGGGAVATLLGPTTDSLLPFMTGGGNVYFQTLGPPKTPGVFGIASTIFLAGEDGTNAKMTENAVLAGRTEEKIFGIAGCANKTNSDLFVFPICAGGTLVSFDAIDPFSNQIALGTVPDDVMDLFFDGFGAAALGEGNAFHGPADDPGDGKGTDLFYVRGDQANSLVRVTNTEGVHETLP